jgi:hypothetical protein
MNRYARDPHSRNHWWPLGESSSVVAVTCLHVSVSPAGPKSMRPQRQIWTKDAIIAAIQMRHSQQKPLNAGKLIREDNALYRAGRRHFSNWRNALIAAGLSPEANRGAGKT